MELKLKEMGARCIEIIAIDYLVLIMGLDKGMLLNLSGKGGQIKELR